jgi:S1-C subfamily serine protease
MWVRRIPFLPVSAVPALATLAWGQATAPARVRLVRSTSGSRGQLQGSRYVIEDPRTTFYADQDRQVVVHFEWEGSPGPHEYKASWKDPTGAVVLVSPFKQTATVSRFAVYWSLALPEAARAGLWAVEVEMDGQPAGVHTFSVKRAREATEPAESSRRVLGPAELYARAQQATLTVESVDAKGERLRTGAGFLVAEGQVATAFQTIEGATRIRVSASRGNPVDSDTLVGWNRRQDWAVLRTPPLEGPPPALDRKTAVQVGDRCAFVNTGAEGARVLADASIVGIQDFPEAGPRLSLSAPIDHRSVGAPLFNEYGEVVGIVGGTLTPGLSALRPMHMTSMMATVQTMAVPLTVLPPAWPEATTPLAELATRGLFTPPLAGGLNVLTGLIARAVEMRNGLPYPVEQGPEISRRQGEAIAYLTWDPQEKRDGMAVFRIHDLDNKVLMEGKPVKVSLRPRQYTVSQWRFPLAPLKPGLYRIDLCIDQVPYWRDYIRVVD